MPFEAQELRRVMGTFCTGVTIITTRDDAGRPFGLTANAITSLSLDPPLVLICVDRKAESHAHFFTSKVFVVNVLSEEQEAISRRFAVSGARSSATSPAAPAGWAPSSWRGPSRTSSAASWRRTRAATT
jgi:flavin reductase (DIM6/NTAB) family NADH-FMN oxidoreductase RutF